VPNFLFYGDTERSYAMRHELPVVIGDPFLLGIVDGRLHVTVSFLDRAPVAAAAPDAVLHDYGDLGFGELRMSGMSWFDMEVELASRAAAAMGIGEAIADPDMPFAIADRLRADGISLHLDQPAVGARRRVKSAAELAGIRRAQAAAHAGLSAAAGVLARAVPDGERLMLDGDVLTSEIVRDALREACAAAGAPAPPDVTVSSVWNGGGHDPGSGPLPANLPIIVDLWPKDEASGCWADCMRTFLVGEVPEGAETAARVVREAIDAARALVRPGITGREVYDAAADVVEAAGFRTQRTENGNVPEDGFQASLGHGVGLAIHEEPAVGLAGHDPLVAGDVITLEPGIFVPGIGEVCFEDLILVTADGCETLTQFSYELDPARA
jgi:Xaa-Pro aminopeptidase